MHFAALDHQLGSLMQVQVDVKWSGKEFSLQLEPTDSVESVKRRLQVRGRWCQVHGQLYGRHVVLPPCS